MTLDTARRRHDWRDEELYRAGQVFSTAPALAEGDMVLDAGRLYGSGRISTCPPTRTSMRSSEPSSSAIPISGKATVILGAFVLCTLAGDAL